jgi:hypothetical protein
MTFGFDVADPKAHVRAAILTGAMTFDPAPLDLFEIRVPAIRRAVDRIEPPLDLRVIPFRYRIAGDGSVHAIICSCRWMHRRAHRYD